MGHHWARRRAGSPGEGLAGPAVPFAADFVLSQEGIGGTLDMNWTFNGPDDPVLTLQVVDRIDDDNIIHTETQDADLGHISFDFLPDPLMLLACVVSYGGGTVLATTPDLLTT